MILLELFMFMVLMVLLGVSFLTLMERKALGLIQLRKGPNKVLIIIKPLLMNYIP